MNSSSAQNGSESHPGSTTGTSSKSKVPGRSSGRRTQGEGDDSTQESTEQQRQASGYTGGTNSTTTVATRNATGDPTAGPTSGGSSVPMNNYAFFVKYTYSNECALLAYNFHEMLTQLGLFEYFTYRHDHRLISVTLAYIFYRYQVHHCDMALDLAVTLVYLEDVRQAYTPELHEQNKDAFNLVCYLAFLAHAFSADRTIRLSDWYKEIGWRSFRTCQQLNGYVFFLFSQVRRFRLRVSESRVKKYIRRLCSVPSQIQNEVMGIE